VIADRFSYKTPIRERTDRRALHTAQVIKMAIEHGPGGVAGSDADRRYPDVVLDGRSPKRARVVAAAAVSADAGAQAIYATRH
jgi:hypothetical protein